MRSPRRGTLIPSLLEAAASVSRNKSSKEQTFDLSEASEPREASEPSPGDFFEATQGSPDEGDEAPRDEGWKNLYTATELLDHDSSHVLQDMAAKASYQELPQDELAEQPPEEAAPAPEEGGTVQVLPDQILEEEDAYAGMDSSDLSLDALHEVIDEVTQDASRGHSAYQHDSLQDPDTLQEPDTSPQTRDPVDDMVSSALDGDPGADRYDDFGDGLNLGLDDSLDDDLNDRLVDEDFDFGSEDKTEVTTVPTFEEPNGAILPADDIFPGDPDLDNEIFESLADIRASERAPGEPAATTEATEAIEGTAATEATSAADSSEEYIPSLDDSGEPRPLSSRSGASTAPPARGRLGPARHR